MKSLKGVRIFSEGFWNGRQWTKKHLQSMVDAFSALESVHKVPLKFGHNTKQPVTDGQPALGWVDNVYLSEDKKTLMADFSNMPDIVFKAIKAKLYRKLSIEMRLGVKHKAQEFMSVLSGVALLGADIPAVNTLGDLENYIPEGEFSADDAVVFELEEPTLTETKEGKEMPEDNVAKQLEKFEARLKVVEDENTALKAENDQLKKDKDSAEAKFATQEAAAKAEKVKTARDEVTKIFDTAVKKEVITPAMRTAFFKVLNVENDDAVLAIGKEDIQALLPEGAQKLFTVDTGHEDGDGGTGMTPDEELSQKAYELMSNNGKLDFAAATEQVMRSDKKLATAYRDMNVEEEA